MAKTKRSRLPGGWVPVLEDLHRRREVLAVAHETGRSRFEVVGLLVAFWGWAQHETEDGRILSVFCPHLVQAVGGDEAFFEALTRVGWLEIDSEGITIPNFDRWFSHTAKRRLRDNLRKSEARREGPKCPQDVRKMSASIDDVGTADKDIDIDDGERDARAREEPSGKALALEFLTELRLPASQVPAASEAADRLGYEAEDVLDWRRALDQARKLDWPKDPRSLVRAAMLTARNPEGADLRWYNPKGPDPLPEPARAAPPRATSRRSSFNPADKFKGAV